MAERYYCDRCGFRCSDPWEQWWFGDYHYCQDCYMVVSAKKPDFTGEKTGVL